ncbi:MAG: RNA-directed DNA polymerase [candidate division Zixibacteria bacterium]|nr:RNA-directed DNA polymerase [candidate division Zixibacteria bacterium]
MKALRRLTILNIKDVSHLCLLLGVSKDNLLSICSGIEKHPNGYYRRHVMVRNGKQRSIATPYGSFRRIIDRLNSFLQRLKFPDNMHGGLKGRTTYSYAKPHKGKKAILKSDIKDFFPNVRPTQVYREFIRLGCAPDVARVITKLTMLDGCLPQGSPTSTVIGNIVTMNLAKRLKGLADSIKASSGTYVDDVVLSGPTYIAKKEKLVLKIIEQEGFSPNITKTNTQFDNQEQVIAGIRVNNGFDAPSIKIASIRAEIEALENSVKSNLNNYHAAIKSIRGKIRYIERLNKGAAKHLSKLLNRSIPQ